MSTKKRSHEGDPWFCPGVQVHKEITIVLSLFRSHWLAVVYCLVLCGGSCEPVHEDRTWSFQSSPMLVNRFLYKNPAMLLVLLLLSPFPIFWTFLKAAGRKPSSSSAITLPSTRSSVKRHWSLHQKVSITHKLAFYENHVSLFFDSEKF